MKRKNTALQMQQFVGEEKNDLLDYLRSLQPEKVDNIHTYIYTSRFHIGEALFLTEHN